jgi:polyhydroxyalkanoate synthesis regulator protein
MDNSVPSYPPQEILKSMDDHEEAPESSEMTWTLSQLIRKVHKVNQQNNAPKEIERDKPIQMLVDTPVQVYEEFTHELSPVNNPVQVYDEFTPEPSPVDTPVQVYDEFTP